MCSSFAGLEADVRFDPDDIGRGAIVASVDASTIDTGVGIRDRHLRKRDYFDVERYPRIRMESLAIERGAGDTHNGTFLLDIKGVHRKVSVPFTFAMRDDGGTFAGSFAINRRDYRIGTSSLILSDDVTVHVTVVVSRVEEW